MRLFSENSRICAVSITIKESKIDMLKGFTLPCIFLGLNSFPINGSALLLVISIVFTQRNRSNSRAISKPRLTASLFAELAVDGC